MSTIAAGTTSGTALVSTGDTSGQLVLQTNGTTTAVTIGTNQVVSLAQPLPVASGGTNSTATATAGGIGYGTGTAHAYTAAGTSGQVLTSAGSSAPTWTTPSTGALTLLATLTPTAAANVDALTTFTASYDSYLILVQGIQTADATGTCTLNMRYAVSGSADANTRYRTTSGASGSGLTFNNTFFNINLGTGTLDATGPGLNASIAIQNINATNSSYKTASVSISCNPAGVSNTVDFAYGLLAYNGTSAVTGVRFYLNNGANFAAQGKIRIYGYSNS